MLCLTYGESEEENSHPQTTGQRRNTNQGHQPVSSPLLSLDESQSSALRRTTNMPPPKKVHGNPQMNMMQGPTSAAGNSGRMSMTSRSSLQPVNLNTGGRHHPLSVLPKNTAHRVHEADKSR
jgi:hypothetical protein